MKTLLTAEMISEGGSSRTLQSRDGLMYVTMGNSEEDFLVANSTLCPRLRRKLKPVTVLLAENRPIVRQGICFLLAQENDIKVIGQALNERQAVELAEKLRPDVVILCAAMASRNRMQVTRHILHSAPSSRVIVVGRHEDDVCVKDAASLGIAGYITEQVSGKTLTRAVRVVCQGASVFNSSLRRRFPEKPRFQEKAGLGGAKRIVRLTSRERQILQLIAEGNANKQTASDLSISVKTVEKHRQHLMAKLGIHETAGLTRYAIAAGIVKCDLIAGAQPVSEPAEFALRRARRHGQGVKPCFYPNDLPPQACWRSLRARRQTMLLPK
jgi:DNA-binding NarL/FixJ family response regulator